MNPSPLEEVLLTVWALSQENALGNRPPLAHVFPKRLAGALRKARKLGYITVDTDGPYLEDEGSALLNSQGFRI